MPITKTFNNTSYSIPLEGELNWSTLSSFLVALADNTQTTNKQKIGTRVATATPVTVLATTDCLIITDLAVAGAVAVNLPAGVTSQVFTVVDGKGDAGTNNITITPAAGTINGAATYVIDSNRAGVTLVYNGTEWTVIAEFISSGDIPRNQIAAGTANHVVINNGSGDLSSEAALAASRGGLATDASAFTGYVKGAAGVFSASAIAAGDLPTGIDATKIADGSVDNTEFQYINSLTSNAQTQINAKVTGAASSTDNAIARFDSTTGKIVQNSGVTVDDSNNVAGVVDITPTTLNSVAIANYLTTTNTKAVTNKDIDGGTASDTSRITIPKASKSTLDGLTRKEGTLVYASDLDKLYADDGSSLKEIGSGGSGINYLADYFTSDTLGTVGNANVTDTGNRSTGTFSAWQSTNTTDISLSVSSSSPLRSPNCYLFSGSGNNASGTKFVESPAFQLHVADLGKPVMVSFDLADVTADGNFDVCMVRYDSSGTNLERISIAGNASGATPASAKLPTGVTKFNGFFISSSTSTDYYALRIRRLAGTDVPRMDSLKISPDSVVQGAAIATEYASNNGTWDATDTTSFVYDSDGSAMGGSLTADRTKRVRFINAILPTDKLTLEIKLNSSGDDNWFEAEQLGVPLLLFPTVPTGVGIVNQIGSTDLDVIFKQYAAPGTTYNSGTGASNWSTGSWARWRVKKQSVTTATTLANRAVEEYASNNSTTDADDTTNFAYGIGGSTTPGTLTTSRIKRIRFKSPIQPTDLILLEIAPSATGPWRPGNALNYVNGVWIDAYGANNTGWGDLRYVSNTDMDVVFNRYRTVTTNWATTDAYWRVRKVSGGASVGFPVSARNVVGDVSGTTVPSGYIGEKLSHIPSALTGSTSLTQWATVTLTAGMWLIIGTASTDGAAGGNYIDLNINTTTASLSGTTIGLDRAFIGVNATNGTGASSLVITKQVSSSTPIYLNGKTDHTAGSGIGVSLVAVRIA